MTNIGKLMKFIRQTFRIDVKLPEEFGCEFIDCETCPVKNECEEADVCCIYEWWHKPFEQKADNNYDAIRNFSMDEMARFLRDATYFDLVPKKYSCDATDCFECKEDLYCFKHWLRQEVKYGSKQKNTV